MVRVLVFYCCELGLILKFGVNCGVEFYVGNWFYDVFLDFFGLIFIEKKLFKILFFFCGSVIIKI